MPAVRAYLAHILGIEPAELGSPDTIVAQGVGVYAGIKAPGRSKASQAEAAKEPPALGWGRTLTGS